MAETNRTRWGRNSMPNITNRNQQKNLHQRQSQKERDNRGFFLPYSFTPKGAVKTGSISAVSGIDINISPAWNLYKSQRNVVIAMIDTGIDYNHEDLSNVLWTNQDEIPGNGMDDDGNGYIDDIYGWNFYNNDNNIYVGQEDDHGTHGAGTIAATRNNSVGIAGIADEDSVSIMSLKALGGEDGSGTTESIIKAIEYAEANGASICNLSLGTTSYDKELYDAMAHSKMLFVVAAGNGDSNGGTDIDETPTYPAAFDLDNIISVANISCDGKLSDSSNYGEKSVDIAAPGSYILSLTADNGYAYMSGTSMAAPMVTGVAALVYSSNANLSLAGVKNVILATATHLDSLSQKVSCGGMLNAGAAVQNSIEQTKK
ncbi:S8 family peptidase [Aminipila terrae]|uniref:S8 family serine peptidase n=1 Tax=Aminipila terrae TaxID=2697030 RepID=A0A6P1MFU4_9FIRM|nr:S8 family peptidase [Aminipila terrae]QHI73570.1 S8 family serine peptidase [Aminipila terrae]